MARPARDERPRAAPVPEPGPAAPPPFSHQALFAAVRSGNAHSVRALLADAEASGASLATLAGEAAAYVAAEAGREEVVRLILSLYEFKAAAVSSRVDLDSFQLLATRQDWLGTPPSFDGTHYDRWKDDMRIYLCAIYPSIWRIVERGYTAKDTDSPTIKEQNEHKNAVAANVILSALSPNERNKVYGLESAKEIWDALQLAHQGTSRVRKLKVEQLMRKLDGFIMEEGETPAEMYIRLIRIVNDIKGLGSKEMTDSFVVRRMLRAITPRNTILATVIRERKDFAKLRPLDVLEIIDDVIGQSSSSQKKYHAPKARKEAKESSSEEESEDQQELALFRQRLNEIFNRQGKSKERTSKKPCYECGETGHFMVNCPNKKNKDVDEKKKENHNKNNRSKIHKKSQKDRAHIGEEWCSNDSSTDSDDEDVHYCLTAIGSKRS